MQVMGLVRCETTNNVLLVKIAALIASLSLSACGIIKEKQEPSPDVAVLTEKPLPPEQAEKLLEAVGGNWFYGQGLGDAALTVGGIVLFPPYGLFVLGNAVLDVSGYEPVRISDALPDEQAEGYREAYDAVTGVPGRVTAAVAGTEFRTRERAKADIQAILKEAEAINNAAQAREETKQLKTWQR